MLWLYLFVLTGRVTSVMEQVLLSVGLPLASTLRRRMGNWRYGCRYYLLYLGTRWMRVVSFALRPRYSRVKRFWDQFYSLWRSGRLGVGLDTTMEKGTSPSPAVDGMRVVEPAVSHLLQWQVCRLPFCMYGFPYVKGSWRLMTSQQRSILSHELTQLRDFFWRNSCINISSS
jgi:hypothetical protein